MHIRPRCCDVCFAFSPIDDSIYALTFVPSQESIPAMVADSIVNGDKKMSYYREHTHALASGVNPGRIMAELFAKDGGTCRGAGGSMHVYDKDTHFQV